MTALLIACLACATIAYVAHSVLLAFLSKTKEDQRLAARRLDIGAEYLALERDRLEAERKKTALPKDRTEMPPDLMARVMSWDDDWAREDERRALMELYAEYGDWDAVRRAYSPPLADNHPEMQVTG